MIDGDGQEKPSASSGGCEPRSESDTRIDQMVADPKAYFAHARQEARREARRYVSKRLRARPA